MKYIPSLLTSAAFMAALILPNPAAKAQETGLGRHKQIYVVPTPGKVQIDGEFDDWDLSGQIEMFVLADGKDVQGSKFALMYDSEAIYVSGEVRDTSPMMNRQDPQVKGDRGWDADSCQFRLTVDPAQAYPIQEQTFDYISNRPDIKAKSDTRDDIVHLTLWNYTDRDEANMNMQLGMTYRTPRAEWAPFGVVPLDKFEGKYVKTADGKGYTFEYRIPWSTLGAKAPLKGGNIVAGTVQFNWGTADGLKTGGSAAWAFDVMSGPGFVFQNAGVWGKMIFSETGNVAKELVNAGVPVAKPTPLNFTYDLPKEGEITLQLVDADNMIRRTILAQASRGKGPNTEMWDGMDDQGKPLPVGTYTVRGIIHDPITGKFQFSLHNSGQPPYPTEDGKGGWGGDHGVPSAASAFADGVLLSWDGCEYGWGIIRVDLQGNKQWGIKSSALLLANDGKRFFAYDPHGFQATTGIQVFDIAEGKALNFGNGASTLNAPEGGDKETNQATGLAYAEGKIYTSYAKRNLIGIFDAESGKPEGTWDIPAPGVLAARPDGTLVAISDGKLVALANGKMTPMADSNLDKPSGIATDAAGLIYVSNQGQSQSVSVFDAAGKFLRTIGKPGGRPAIGRYETDGLFQPEGLAVSPNGNLWVAEQADYPKRISVWEVSSGKFQKEFFGGSEYFGYATMDPAVPDEIFAHNVLWQVDWDKKTVEPITTIWRQTLPDMWKEADPGAYPQGFRLFTAENKHQFGWGVTKGARNSTLYRRDGDVFRPFLSLFQINWSHSLYLGQGIPLLDDREKMPDGSYVWQDTNDDQRVQSEELYRFEDKNFRLSIKDIAPDMTIWGNGGLLLKPTKFLANGQPVYDPEKLEKSFLAGNPAANNYLWLDPDGGVYTLTSGQIPSLAKWGSDGKMEWGYPSIARWHDSLGMPPVKAGRLWGMTGPLGVAGDITGNMTYFGVCHLFQRSTGLYVAAIMKDARSVVSGPEVGQPEGQGGSLIRVVTKPGTAPRTFIFASGQDSRVTEVLGLDSIQALPDRTFTLNEEDVATASAALSEFNAKYGSAQKLVVVAGLDALKSAPAAPRDLDGLRGFKTKAAYDEKNLYVSYEVDSPSELINAMTDPKLLFKGGNCLDIQIATDPNADPARKTPAPGDVRLLVTRQLGADGKTPEPYAVLFRPKVKDFAGQPIVLNSPTGKESFDEITVVEGVAVEYRKTPNGFTAVATIPLQLLGFTPQSGKPVKMDLGYVFGNETGNKVTARAYLKNRSFSANVVNDVPNESRLEPAEWDDVQVK